MYLHMYGEGGGSRRCRPAPAPASPPCRQCNQAQARATEHTTVEMGAIGFARVPCSSVESMTATNRKRVRTAVLDALRCRVALALDKVDQMPDSIVETGEDVVFHWSAPCLPGV